MSVVKVLSGHYSPETAFMIEDYPYGRKLRCKKRVWLEVNDKGTRLCEQTTNPKQGDKWNAVHKSTYCLAGAMYLDDVGHVHWCGCSAYDASKMQAFLDTYSVGLTEGERNFCVKIAEGYASLQARKELNSKVDMTLPPY
jgi:hypothetical protein